MSPRITLFALVLTSLTVAQDAQPGATRDDAWKGGASVPPGAIGIVAGVPVPVDVFVDEMAARHVRNDSPIGRQTLDSMVDEILVTNEATRRRIAVPEPELDRKVAELDCQLRQHKTCLEAEMRSKGIPMETFRAKLRQQLLLEAVTREDQRIPAGQKVGNDQQKVWLKNKRDAAKIEMDRTKLRRGEAAMIDDTPIDDRAFVRALLGAADKKDVRSTADFVMQYVFAMNLLEQAAGALTDADVDQELEERKRTFESNPEYRGIAYEAIIKERTGLDAVALKASRGFRMNAAVSKLSRKLFSMTDVQGYYDSNLPSFGPRYTVTHLLIRGSDRPLRDQSGKALTQPLAQARQQIDGIRREIEAGKRFEDVIPMYSEHFPTRLRGGKLEGFTPRSAPQAFPELGEAVTKLEIGRISEPLLTSAGYHLVRVDGIEPAPPVTKVEAEIRQMLGKRYFTDSYAKAAKGWDIRVD